MNSRKEIVHKNVLLNCVVIDWRILRKVCVISSSQKFLLQFLQNFAVDHSLMFVQIE
jgi:hypothetical protein